MIWCGLMKRSHEKDNFLAYFVTWSYKTTADGAYLDYVNVDSKSVATLKLCGQRAEQSRTQKTCSRKFDAELGVRWEEIFIVTK